MPSRNPLPSDRGVLLVPSLLPLDTDVSPRGGRRAIGSLLSACLQLALTLPEARALVEEVLPSVRFSLGPVPLKASLLMVSV